MQNLESFLRPRGPQTVWSSTTNALFGPCFSLADRCASSGPRTKTITLLKNLNGVIETGKITLLLGAPHSGNTQLIPAL